MKQSSLTQTDYANINEQIIKKNKFRLKRVMTQLLLQLMIIVSGYCYIYCLLKSETELVSKSKTDIARRSREAHDKNTARDSEQF